MSKPRTKKDIWCYTATKKISRRKIKRASSKAGRKEDKGICVEYRREDD